MKNSSGNPLDPNSKEYHARILIGAIYGDTSDFDVQVIPPNHRNGQQNETRYGIMSQNDAHRNGKIRVLVLAEACNPKWSSVPLVGYNQIMALARRPDLEVTLATHVRNQEGLAGDPILKYLRDLEFIDSDTIARPMYRLGQMLRGGKTLGWTTNMALAWPGYVLFERLVWKRFEKEIRNDKFDVIHRVTPVSPTMPSPIASWTKIPFVVGPLNGGLAWPKEYPELKKGEREWLIPLRRAYRLLPWHRKMRRNAAMVLAGSRSTASELSDVPADRLKYMPENGFDFRLLNGITADRPARSTADQPLKLISVARLVPYKALDIAMEALARCPESWSEWTIVGDGPLRESLESTAAELGISGKITWTGWVEQTEVVRKLMAADVLIQPSLREFGGGAVLEAMACGTVPVIVDYGGPAELVTEGTGLKLPMVGRADLIASLSEAVRTLGKSRERLAEMSRAAIAHVADHLTWDAKAEELAKLYQELAQAKLVRTTP
jgi:glycosyltransferase involved in cell wall biosynthesis